MLTVDLNALELPDRGPGLRAAFPISSAEGTSGLAIVWIELVPGGRLSEHTDSAEELKVLLSRQHEHESRPVGLRGLVGELGADRLGETARDCKAEAGTDAFRGVGAREPLE